jgi:multidrug efflux pump subunit AcrB
MNIGKFSVENPVFVNILTVALLVLGGFSILRMPREQFAEVPFYWVSIAVPYPGAAAEEIEKTVTLNIENEIRGMKGLKRLQSVTSEGLSLVRVEFDDGIAADEFERLYQEVTTRFGRVSLPQGALDGKIDDFSSSDFLPVIQIILSGGESDELSRISEILEERILSVPEVSSVERIGARKRRIFIEADRERLEAYKIDLSDIVRAIEWSNITVPAGTLSTRSREYLLRTGTDLLQSSRLERIIVRSSAGGGAGVRVANIAEVRDGYETRGAFSRYGGKPAVILSVAKVPQGDSIGVVGGIKKVIGSFEKELPGDMKIDLLNDSTVQIRDSINVLVMNALLGLGLLVGILFLFLGFRNALITALGIPVTFAVTFIFLEAMGETLNGNTLFGLVLVLGMIVDHAIVIIENSYRLEAEGLPRREAGLNGVNQVLVPVLAATATTVAAFLPLMILPGILGKFLRVIPLVVSLALVISTAESLVFLPAHYSDWPGGKKKRPTPVFDALRRRFEKFLGLLYQRRWITVTASLVFMAAVFSLIPRIGQDLFSSEDYSYFFIDIEMPPGTNTRKTDETVREFERRILTLSGNGEVKGVVAYSGLKTADGGPAERGNHGQILVDLMETKNGRRRSVTDIMAGIKTLCGDIPGVENVNYRKVQSGPPTDPPVAFRVRGDRYEDLMEVSRIIRERLGAYPELFNINDTLESGTPEIRVRVNEDMAVRFGLSTAAVGAFLRGTLDGFKAGTVFIDNKEIEILVRYGGSGGYAVRDLLSLKIPTPDGRVVPFSTIASIREEEPLSSIKRVDGKREVSIRADAYTKTNVRNINADIRMLFDEDLSRRLPGLELIVGGEFAEFANLLLQILRVFLIGVFLIYIILGTQFKSYSQPFLILFTVPFGFAGIILFLFFSGTPLSTTVIYAGVALAGIAVNDAIVLISFINGLRRKDSSVSDAVLRAASSRLRPILLTSITTIGGLLPTALGIGGVSPVWGPMASTIIFGLVFSTLGSVFLVPCLYGIFPDRQAGQ